MPDLSQTLIIGVDGGGTRCRAAIGTLQGGVLARADGGPANVSSDPEGAIAAVLQTVRAAARSADAPEEKLGGAIAHLGLAGVMTERHAADVANAMPFAAVKVTDDRPTALNGALGGREGALLSVGTGTIAATNTGGAFISVGGWGLGLGDQASGAWIGQRALRQTMLCVDGILPHSDLTRAILAQFDGDPNAIVAFSLSATPRDYGGFAPLAVEHATAGDPIARVIMQKGAEHLQSCLSALNVKAGDAVCLTGGVGPHYAAYLPTDVRAGLVAPHGDALDGAYAFAKAALERQQGGTA